MVEIDPTLFIVKLAFFIFLKKSWNGWERGLQHLSSSTSQIPLSVSALHLLSAFTPPRRLTTIVTCLCRLRLDLAPTLSHPAHRRTNPSHRRASSGDTSLALHLLFASSHLARLTTIVKGALHHLCRLRPNLGPTRSPQAHPWMISPHRRAS